MSSPVSLELSAKIAEWRRKAADGTLTQDEMREAIVHLRAGRLASANASATAKRAGKKSIAAPSADSLLDEMGE